MVKQQEDENQVHFQDRRGVRKTGERDLLPHARLMVYFFSVDERFAGAGAGGAILILVSVVHMRKINHKQSWERDSYSMIRRGVLEI